MVAAKTEPKTTRSDRAEKTKARIIEAAMALFSERGYENATTRELADRAGCSEGIIYKHFGGKRELLIASLEAERQKYEHKFEGGENATDLEDEIIDILKRSVAHSRERRDFMRVCISLSPIDPDLARITEGIERDAVHTLTERLTRLKASGLIRPDADIDAAAVSLRMLTFGVGILWEVILRRDRTEIDDKALAIARHFARSLRP